MDGLKNQTISTARSSRSGIKSMTAGDGNNLSLAVVQYS
jgi:hypothetical protein